MNEAPAQAHLHPSAPPAPFAGLVAESFEVVSRGDFVNGYRIRRAERRATTSNDARPGLLVLVHDAGEAADGARWKGVAPWIARGVDAVAIDLPLHGRRASAKLSERLVSSLAALARGDAISVESRLLVDEFERQAVCDLERTLAALLARDENDPKRTAIVGLGLGAWLAEAWLGQGARATAAVLVRTPHAPATRSEARQSTATPADRPSLLTLEATSDPLAWSREAEPFLASRLGF